MSNLHWPFAVIISCHFSILDHSKSLTKWDQVAYKLDLPPSAAVPPAVHVSQLKKHAPPKILLTNLYFIQPLSLTSFLDPPLLSSSHVDVNLLLITYRYRD